MRLSPWFPVVAVLSLVAAPAFAQLGNGVNPECLGSNCGSPKEEGGGCGCGCGCGCSVWVAYTDDGKTLSYTDDADGDGKSDDVDNCPFATNRDQLDGDGDGVGDSCDNCAALSNFNQLDTDGDASGDVCDGDLDGDTIDNALDNCPSIPNKDQLKTNGAQALGNVCNNDDDGDGILDTIDVCPLLPNPGNVQLNDSRCNADQDGDNVSDTFDNCLSAVNATQLDTDLDGLGDVCDFDIDNDGVLNQADNCSLVRNRAQLDDDGDGIGDQCDAKYCVVIDPNNKDDCLDPNSPFRVHGGGQVMLKAGEKFRLPLFANRNGAAIEYTWTVKQRPAGSQSAVSNPQGVVTMSRHWEYAYPDGNVPSFTADVDGDYTLQLQAKLVFADRAYPNNREATSGLKLSASPDRGANGCSTGADVSLMALGLGLLVSVTRRRTRR
ncbi:MAG: thrombospondin type 3 repeat-containing protein [Myxococcaceae bacterium]